MLATGGGRRQTRSSRRHLHAHRHISPRTSRSRTEAAGFLTETLTLRALCQQLLRELAQFLLQPSVLGARRRAGEARVHAADPAVASEIDRGGIGAEVDE